MVETARRRGATAVASYILDWSGTMVDFVDGALNFQGKGFQLEYGTPVERLTPEEKPLLFACGCAMLVDRAVLAEGGGWDQGAFAYYEDVELGWRLHVLGYEVWLAPRRSSTTSITAPRDDGPSRRGSGCTSAIRSGPCMGCSSRTSLERALPAALMLAVEKALLASKLARPMTGRRRSPGVLTFLEGDSAQPRHHQDDDRAPDARASGCRRALRSRKGRPGVAASGRSCRCAGRLTTSNLTRPPPGSSRNRSRSIRRRRWPGSTHSCLDLPSSVSAVPPFNPSDASPTRTWSSTFGGHWVNPGPVPFQLEYNAVHALLVRQFAIEALKVRPAVGGGIEARGRRAP